MKLHTENDFLERCSRMGIVLDKQYPQAAVLVFEGQGACSRFWEVPSEPGARPYFLSLLLDKLGSWGSCFVWRHRGSWPLEPDEDRLNHRVEFLILQGLGIPRGGLEVLEFGQEEEDQLITLLFTNTIFGWHGGDDLVVVPDHGRFFLLTDHHGAVFVYSRSEDAMAEFVSGMERSGFQLPQDVPDSTFRKPDWMRPGSGEG